MAATLADEVVARYGNWYQGSDDQFAHCLISGQPDCTVILQGLQVVEVRHQQASGALHAELVRLLAQPIPAGWPAASYDGFNFFVDPHGPNASEIAVFGVQATDTRPPGQYYAAPPDSQIGQLVKSIAGID